MAKKRQQNKKKLPSTSSVNTSTPIKGMIKDVDSAYFSKENWWHARNLANNSIDGDTGVVGNEPANLSCGEVPYTIIGTIHLYGDKWVLYATDDSNSEIGLFDDSKCEYTTLVNAPCLNFNRKNLIIGAAKENFDCTWQVYWDDNLNPSRTLNIDDVPYIQEIVSGPGDPCIIYENVEPLQLDCEKLRLHPLMDMACLRLEKADEGGALLNGSYQAFIAYCDNAQQIGDYFINSNITSVWSHENTNSSIVLHLDGLDTDFEFFKLVIREKVANVARNIEFGVYSTETKRIPIDFIDPELPTIDNPKLLIDNPVFEKSAGMFVVNDYLIRSQPTEYFDFNYQPLANQIKAYWTSVEYPEDYYKNGGNNPTFLRDEQYSFFIRFIYNTGEFSKSYHIPGRAPRQLSGGGTEDGPAAANTIDGSERNYNVYNTFTSLGLGDPFLANIIGTTTPDGGLVTHGGEMGFWQSTEVYPQTQPERYNASAHPWSNPGTTEFDLCGLPIRHHKIPDESQAAISPLTGNNSTALFNPSNSTINVLGVAFDNIAPPVDNDGNLIENITGYQIMVGSRDGKKSIIAKGIIKNMMRARKDRNDEDYRLLVPNYPYNDLRMDPYLLDRGHGNRAGEPWYAQLLSWDTNVEDNWQAGNTDISSGAQSMAVSSINVGANNPGVPFVGSDFGPGKFDENTYTFHSPDLNFTKTYLNPTEVKVYKNIYGNVTGRFKTVEGHTQHKLLKNKVVLLAAIYGVGYAIMKMRGERNYALKGTRSHSVGEFGTYAVGSGTHGSPFPGVGTGYGALNAGAQNLTQAGALTTEYFAAGGVDTLAILGGASEASKVHLGTQQQAQLGAALLSGGHQGPEFNMEFRDSEFNAVPGVGTFITGILTFINFVAIGGDKLVQLILDLVSFQDYALKYISHGFYQGENPVDLNGTFRAGIDRARYIKQALQSFDGDNVVHNLLRPSTVVLRHTPGVRLNAVPDQFLDNTKFTLGAGPCAGLGNNAANWWQHGEEIRSRCSANYVSIKNQIDNQYGQLDSIIQLPIFGCTTSYASQQDKDGNGNLVPVQTTDRFSTQVLFGGDSYIARYTEKTNMPFFYQFLKDDEERGYQWNYSRYANVPFPRYWYNSEKYRMGEFVRPITDLDFNWTGALPDGMYNLDTSENGGYCPPGGPGFVSFGDPSGLGSGNPLGDPVGSGGTSATTIFTPVPLPASGAIAPSANNTPEYVLGAESQRYLVYDIPSGNLETAEFTLIKNANLVSVQSTNSTITLRYPNTTSLDQAVRAELIDSGITNAEVTIDLNLTLNIPVPYTTPFGSGSGNCNIDTHVSNTFGSGGCVDTYDELTADTGGTAQMEGAISGVRIIFDWQSMTVVGITNAAGYNMNGTGAGTAYAANQYSSASGNSNPQSNAPYNGTPVPTDDNYSLINFSSTAYDDSSNGCGYQLAAGTVRVVNGFARCRNSSSNGDEVTMLFSGVDSNSGLGGGATTGQSNYDSSIYNPTNYEGAGGRATGGMFVWKYGYIYTHNSGINDWYVETDLNLAYRDYEDVKRKRHYDNDDYTDLVELFHSQIIGFDNYYNYDKSVSVRRFWSVSFSKIQERWYDATTAEQCFTQYPKRLIYSVPATGFMDKVKQTNKNDKAIDFWRVFLAENFRDFKSPINAIVPYNQTGALMLFPTLSPKVFQGVDKLQLTRKKVIIGDGGLFSQVLQNAANSNVSHEYGSCESYRSVLNTPQGVYFVSQAQGKVFLYQAGRGLQAISDIGMKWWFNKFLPSRLLADFPGTEDCPEFIDNPVIAAGINTVYDPNDDIVYFCKRDYKAHDHVLPCIDFIPCEGFVYNASACDGVAQTQECPDGYNLVPGTGGDPDQCCQITNEPALSTIESAEVDIVIAIDSSNSIEDNGNVSGMINIVSDLVAALGAAQNSPGEIRIGFVHFGAGRADINGNLAGITAPVGNDTMFNEFDQQALSDDFSASGPLFTYINNIYNTAVTTPDNPSGTDLIGGIWAGLNILYGSNGRPNAEKRLITLADGPQFTKNNGAVYISPVDVHDAAGVVNPVTPNVNIGSNNEGVGNVYDAPLSTAGAWFNTNVKNNSNYTHLKSYFIGLDTVQVNPTPPPATFVTTPNLNQQTYFAQFANDDGTPAANDVYTFFGTVQDPDSVQEIVDAVVDGVIPDPNYYCPDSACDLIMPGPTGVPICRCTHCVDPTLIDVTFPIDLQDEQYFKDVSWTVSYDPKSKAWISFHDWHPELTMNSINHFLTTKSKEGTVPICPPGATWNGVECCTTAFQQTPAIPIINEILGQVNTVPTGQIESQRIDIIFAVDVSSSTISTNTFDENGTVTGNIQDLQRNFVQNIINSYDFSTGNVRAGVATWSAPTNTNQLLIGLTDNQSALIAATNSYSTGGMTDYRNAIEAANSVVNSVNPDTLADTVVCIMITDSNTDRNFTLNEGSPLVNYSDLFTDLKVVMVHQGDGTGFVGFGCDNTTWQRKIAGLVDRFVIPDAQISINPAGQYGGFEDGSTQVICNAPNDNANLYEVTSCTDCDVCNTCYQNVAAQLVDTQLDCGCPPNTIPDQNPANPPCESLNNPPLCVVNCSCPPGYVLIGQCNNSANPPICRSVDCECPPSESLGLPSGVTPTATGDCSQELIETINTTTIESTEADGTNVGQQLFMTNPGFNSDITGPAQTPSPWMRGYECKNATGDCAFFLNDPNNDVQTMSPDTLPYFQGGFGLGQNLPPYEGSSYVGLLQAKVQYCQQTDFCCGAQGGGLLTTNGQITYYQEGVWQRLLDANGTPTEMEMNIEYTGSVQLSQVRDYMGAAFELIDSECQQVGTAPAAEQNLDYAPSIEIWGGTHAPLSQGDNYKGHQFDYPLGTDTVGYSKMLWRSGPVTSIDEWVEYQYSLNVNDSDGSIEAEYGKFKYIFIKIQIVKTDDGQPGMLPANRQYAQKYVVMDGFTNPRIPTIIPETTTTVSTESVITNATTCTYQTQVCTPPNYITGGIWRHNVRTDLFANFYNVQYPWEVDIIETTGQTVNTLRSVEYHLESYFYSEDQLNRFHDLDYNFDEAVIYNSEQISGLLNLVLTPKNNSPLAMSYPIINPNSIDILFSKEEQKYRFNQFFDVTNDRGEFSGAITQMFETEQNGYIINLNPFNLNYNKPQHERKKFRHYFNHLILRKSADAAMTRKMLLRLENFKLNVSFR